MILNAKIKYTLLGVNPEADRFLCEIGFATSEGEFSTGRMEVGTDFIRNTLRVLELQRWEDLPRKYARIKIENRFVVSIGNLLIEEWSDTPWLDTSEERKCL